VSKELPVYEVTDQCFDPDFLSTLLRSRYLPPGVPRDHHRAQQPAPDPGRGLREPRDHLPPSKKDQRKLIADVIKAARLQRGEEALAKYDEVVNRFGDFDEPDLLGRVARATRPI
jgi:hypothetical protein